MLTMNGLPPSQRFWAMIPIYFGVALSSIDGLIANIALPVIVRDLHTTAASTIWVVTAYQLAITVLILPLAALGEIVGCRRIYMAGLVLFTLGSLGCALAPTLPVLVAFRILQGVGASGLSSVSTALLRYIQPRERLGRALGFYAVMIGVSLSAGPSAAAAILSVASWPWLFAINVPIGILAIATGIYALPETNRTDKRFDWKAGALTALALGLAVIGLDGMGDPATRLGGGIEMAVGLGIGVLLWITQGRRPAPLVPVDLLRIPLFALSTLTSIGAYSTQILSFVALPFFLQVSMGRGDSATGLLITPWPLVLVACAPIAGRLSDRVPAGLLSSAGLVILAAGLALLVALPVDAGNADIVWRMVVAGIGFGFFQTPNNRTLMTTGPIERGAAASGMLAVARLLGMSLGAAMAALIFGILGTHAARTALSVGIGIALTAAIVSLSRLRAPRPI